MKKKTPIFKFRPFSRKQRQVMNWWMKSSPVKDRNGIIADGAIRSGKTVDKLYVQDGCQDGPIQTIKK